MLYKRRSIHSTQIHNNIKNIYELNIQSLYIFLHWYRGEPRSTPSCRNWTGAVGSCRFGAACHFRHEELTPELRRSFGFRLSNLDLEVPRCSDVFVEGWRIWSNLLKTDENSREGRPYSEYLRIRSKDSSILSSMPKWSMSRDEHQTATHSKAHQSPSEINCR